MSESLFATKILKLASLLLIMLSQRTTSQTPGDDQWDIRLRGPAGVEGTISATAKLGNEIIFGGAFAMTSDGVLAANVIAWNPATGTWRSFGKGVSGPVSALAVIGQDLYVGGQFTTAGDTTALSVARWDGNKWSPLATGVFGTVSAMTVYGTDLIVGGSFQLSESGGVKDIARWDGTQWHGLNSSIIDAPVSSLVTVGTDVYAGGFFSTAGYIVRWDGSKWSKIGSGTDGPVYVLATDGVSAYVGGNFSNAGGSPASFVARTNGTSWFSLGAGPYAVVRAMFTANGRLYAGGDFLGILQMEISTNQWSPLGEVVGLGGVRAILTNGTDVYAGGGFVAAGAIPVKGIAKWSGTSWGSIDGTISTSVNGPIVAIATDGDDIYVGGSFGYAGTVQANNIARWNRVTHTWSTVGSGSNNGVDGGVGAIAITKGMVYVGGGFRKAGDSTAFSIARWDGSQWHPLGLGFVNGSVSSMAFHGTDLYVVAVAAVGRVRWSVNKWDGQTWSSLLSIQFPINRLAFVGNDLYAAGGFSSGFSIARWDGTQWLPLGNPPNDGVIGEVDALGTDGTSLYVGGSFVRTTGSSIQNVARWDGSQWWGMGDGLNGKVGGFLSVGRYLYATGAFTKSGAIPMSSISRWDSVSQQWSPLGSGLDGNASVLTMAGSELFVGGSFTSAGKQRSYHLAGWNTTTPTGVALDRTQPNMYSLDQNYPNPFNPSTTIRFTLSKNSNVRLEVYNTLGQRVSQLVEGPASAGEHKVVFDASQLASGAYIYRLDADGDVQARKLMILR